MRTLRTLAAALLLLSAPLCAAAPARASTAVGGGVVGQSGYYDYNASAIQSGAPAAGTTLDYWWCGDLPGHTTDTILRETYSFTGGLHVSVPEHEVMRETPGAWDSRYTCNPDVVEGSFPDVLGDGVTYSYAMYYVGYGDTMSADNQIGAAFSTDGDHWVKAPGPVVTTSYTGTNYGAAQPNVSYVGGRWVMLYEYIGGPVVNYEATSTDGLHFSAPSAVTTAGLPSPTPSWGSVAYDTADGRWYATVNDDPNRAPSTTGGVAEEGQMGFTLYATSDLAAGTWQQLDSVDTNLTGYEGNFLAGILRDPDGNVFTPGLPDVQLYPSTSLPRPAANATPAQRGSSGAFNTWDIAWATYVPGSPLRALTRYYSSSLHVHEVTTGWVDTSAFHVESVLGHLYEAPTSGFTRPLYGCVAGSDDYLVSQDAACEGQLVLGVDGYISPVSGAGLVELYRCYTGSDHFVSTSASCEGRTVEGVLGWAQP